MPSAAPFTRLCQLTNASVVAGRADLHLHSTASDGVYSPTQIVDLARRSGLAAIALTDHDTLAGFQSITDAGGLEIVPGVEISTEDEGREFHLLGYFFDPDDPDLNHALERLRASRVERFGEMADRLRRRGLSIPIEKLPAADAAVGRRHLAALLFATGQVSSIREAFHKYLGDGGPASVPKALLPLPEAIAVVRGAGGLTSCAHPRADLDLNGLRRLADLGLQAVEAVYPGFSRSRVEQLRGWARSLHLAITAGSDCHGPDEPKRAVGACTLSADEWKRLRRN